MEIENTDVTLDSSPSTLEVPATESSAGESTPLSLEQMSPEQRAQWRLTGETPTTPTKPEASAASPETSETTEDSSKPAPASQPDKPQEQNRDTQQQPPARKPKGKDAAARIQELLAENRALKAERDAAVSRPADPGDPRTSPPAQPKPQATAPPTRQQPVQAPIPPDDPMPAPQAQPDGQPWPGATRAEQWQAYDAARLEWVGRQAVRNVEYNRQNEQARTNWQNAEAALAKQPEFADYHDTIASLQINQQTKAFVLRNPDVGPNILYLLGKNPEAAAAAARLGPEETIELLVGMKAGILQSRKPAAAAAPPTKVTRTPKPATELSNRNAAPADEEELAVANRDYRAFARAANARDLGKR